MTKVMTFASIFPDHHPKNGEPTYFAENILESLSCLGYELSEYFKVPQLNRNDRQWIRMPKFHTIRSGNNWKVGDRFSPVVWTGKPYISENIAIGPDIEIKQIWDFKIEKGQAYLSQIKDMWRELSFFELEKLAKNDGLLLDDLKEWFNWSKDFNGQIICWNKAITY